MREFPIFSAKRFEMKPRPTRCYYFEKSFIGRAVAAQMLEADGDRALVHMQINLPHDSTACETRGIMAHFRVDGTEARGSADRVKVRIYTKGATSRWWSVETLARFRQLHAAGKLRDQRGVSVDVIDDVMSLLCALSYVSLVEQGRLDADGETDDAPEPRADRPVLWVPKGDTLRYARARLERVPVQARDLQRDEVIRKREHEVRSHYRTLRSGARVKVRAHTRGDPALGRVETHYSLE